jgi:alkylhydroperoxidase family enzyme
LRLEVRAALALLERLTLSPEEVGPVDIEEVRRAGVSDRAIEDAMAVCALFNVIDRIADSFEFHRPDESAYEMSADSTLKFGYALPKPLRR